jgi:hypothetical protein
VPVLHLLLLALLHLVLQVGLGVVLGVLLQEGLGPLGFVPASEAAVLGVLGVQPLAAAAPAAAAVVVLLALLLAAAGWAGRRGAVVNRLPVRRAVAGRPHWAGTWVGGLV